MGQTTWGLAALVAVCTALAALPASAEEVVVPLNDCARPENGDPIVTSVAVHPTVVDVTAGPAAVTVVVSAEDTGGPGPASGVAEVRVGLAADDDRWPGLPVDETSHDAGAVAVLGSDGLHRATVRVPQGAPPGPWHALVQVVDRLGFRHSFFDALEVDPGPSRLTVTSGRDGAKLELTGLTLSRSVVDTRREPRLVDVSAVVRAGSPGLAHVRVVAVGTEMSRAARVELRRRSVTGQVETWHGRLRIPRWAGSQRWSLSVVLADEMGGYRRYDRPHLVHEGLPGGIHVRSRTDRERPSTTFLRLRPGTLDLTEEDGRIAVRVRVRDASSGVRSVTARLGPEENGPPDEYPLRRVSGGPRDGIWRGSIPVDRCSSFEDFGLVRVSASDRAEWVKSARSTRQGLRVRVRWPDVRAELPGASPDALSLDFSEPVVGISPTSAVLVVDMPQRVVTGTWSCLDGAGAEVDCIRGPVRHADLHVADLGSLPALRTIRLNPEHTLDVRDLAGNPFYRFDVSGSWG